MTLKDLIQEGESVKASNTKTGMSGDFITGEEYETWIAKCIIFLENHEGDFSPTVVERFVKASEKAVGNSVKLYHTMIGILKALDQMSEE